MDNKKKIIILIFIFIIILFAGYVLTKNNVDNIDNSSIDGNLSRNTSSNHVNTSDNISDNSSKDNFSFHDSNSLNQYNHQHKKNSKNKSNVITEDDIRELVKNNVGWPDGHGGHVKDVKIGKIYKGIDGSWLVHAFDKKTGKFLGAVWVSSDTHKDNNGKFSHIFSHGPESYAEYKDIVSGKSSSRSKINEYNQEHGFKGIIEDSDSSDFHLLAKSNPYSEIVEEFSPDLDESTILDSNPIISIDESNTEYNSTI